MNLKLSFRGLSFILAILLAISCESDEMEGIVQLKDHEYMPLHGGLYHIYAITETEYINGPAGESKSYQLRMEITDSLPSTNGYFTYVIQLSTRSSADQAWVPSETWSALFNEREAIVQEGNTSFVKLALPLAEDRTWNGNIYNAFGQENYTIGLYAQPLGVGNLNFTDAIEVIQKNETDPIVGNDVRNEIYVRGVGLVSRKVETIVYCSNNQSCIGQQIIESGVIKEQVLIEYGRL
jgi:hypothetical protein